ncbi:MAG: prepilin-type N-terminal cleavage/methylation domain-containing protein [Candidatus Paceibacterota bacterium]|jgi:prepilin-type N-terminal cleavage/methylation domain-containing protein
MKKGFSLIETLVATAIIVMASVGPLALAGQSLAQANYIKDQIVATFLAQEGLEIMRNYRDTLGIAEIALLYTGINGTHCVTGDPCSVSGIDMITTPATNNYFVANCDNDPCLALNYDSENSLYCYPSTGGTAEAYCSGTNAPSIFTRSITVEQIVADKEYKIHSIVTWRRGYGPRTIELTENLFERTW